MARLAFRRFLWYSFHDNRQYTHTHDGLRISGQDVCCARVPFVVRAYNSGEISAGRKTAIGEGEQRVINGTQSVPPFRQTRVFRRRKWNRPLRMLPHEPTRTIFPLGLDNVDVRIGFPFPLAFAALEHDAHSIVIIVEFATLKWYRIDVSKVPSGLLNLQCTYRDVDRERKIPNNERFC